MNSLSKRNRRTFPSLFDDFFNKAWMDFPVVEHRSFVPATNVKETDTAFLLEVAAPGLNKEDFHIHLDKNVLTISSEKKQENENKEGDTYTRKEFSYQSFSRAFTLPETVDGEQISAAYANGVLLLTLPKKEVKVDTSKMIEIS